MLKYFNSQVSGTGNDRTFHRIASKARRNKISKHYPILSVSMLPVEVFSDSGVSSQIHKFLCVAAAMLLNANDLSYYVCFLMSSNTADVRTGKHSQDRNVQNVFTLTKQQIISYHRSVSDRT
jgi:hypothetical protein